ncbi:MAG: hypothetical protein GY866_29645 [Proteobacteria bacterium]|nr:hypothetical protein [Pseudomonadota bacterium]
MLDKSASDKALKKLFRRSPIVDMETLFRTVETRSRMSVFRRLNEIGYYSSYTHTGRYYTLVAIPLFDEHGLWFHQGIGFTRSGTLKATIVELVGGAPAGITHMELSNLLRIRVHNTLLSLVRERLVDRKRIDKEFLYVDSQSDKAAEQVARRRKQLADVGDETVGISAATVIEVLVEIVRAGRVYIDPSLIAGRLSSRGVPVTDKQIEQVFIRYGINGEKKTEELP